MTIANTFAAKAGVAFVAIAMALLMVAPAKAQTAEELQAQIDSLMATIASLQSQLGVSGSTSTSASAYVFTRALTVGDSGADVTALQNYLIGAGFSIPAGATGYFGAQTQAAVAAWQTANGVMPAAGYFGPVSQAKYNALMAAQTPSTGDNGDDNGDDTDNGDSDTLGAGEASLENFDGQDGEDTDIEEGQEAAPVAEFEFDVEDGDFQLDRMDVSFVSTDGEDEPWDAFDEISLWVDGDEVASEDVSDEDDWMDDEPYSGANTFRFNGIDTVFHEGDTANITVAVSVQGSVDGSDTGNDWTVFIDQDGIRGVDGEGIDQYTGEEDEVTATNDIDEGVDFTISEEGADDELIVKSSTEDPESTTLQLEDDDRSDFMTVFAFDLDTEDSTNDIELNHILVDVTVSSSTYSALVNDAQLVIDGDEYDDVTVTNGNTTTATLDFDIDGDAVIEAGDRVTVEVQLEFKALANGDQGTTIQATVDGSEIEAEGADDLNGEKSTTGDLHTLRTSGAVLELTSTSESLKANTDSTTADDEGVFVLKFDVTAFDEDLYVDKNAARTSALGTAGVSYLIEDEAGATEASGTSTASLSSTADTENSAFIVREGETETFTLTVNYDPATSGFYQVQIVSLNTDDDSNVGTSQQMALPASDFESDQISI
jgi:peptidoglycan hydrolase-like protein with peptidoglycan-binding domain